jgi:hypothetical protein
MKLFQCGVRDDYGKEWYITVLTGKRYSLLQAAIDYGEYGGWIELPYFQMSMGYGRLLSVLFSIGRVGFTFDIAGRNWRDELFYTKPNEITKD